MKKRRHEILSWICVAMSLASCAAFGVAIMVGAEEDATRALIFQLMFIVAEQGLWMRQRAAAPARICSGIQQRNEPLWRCRSERDMPTEPVLCWCKGNRWDVLKYDYAERCWRQIDRAEKFSAAYVRFWTELPPLPKMEE